VEGGRRGEWLDLFCLWLDAGSENHCRFFLSSAAGQFGPYGSHCVAFGSQIEAPYPAFSAQRWIKPNSEGRCSHNVVPRARLSADSGLSRREDLSTETGFL
jgi:hypothetical protein